MGDQMNPKKVICVGMLAHVDAGKTTLSEALLYTAGQIRKLGRVDKGDAYLDTDAQERARGITIFSKQAVIRTEDAIITLLDTPGHVDFSAEMERTLQVLDGAVLVISASDGIQGHTRTLWTLLKNRKIPVLIFVNKMDQPGADREQLIRLLQDQLDGGCVDFTDYQGNLSESRNLPAALDAFYDQLAMCDEAAMEAYLESGSVPEDGIRQMIRERKVFPCWFGSALKLTGVDAFFDGLIRWMPGFDDHRSCLESGAAGQEDALDRIDVREQPFGARVYKISRDPSGVRLTHIRVLSGSLAVRELVQTGPDRTEKVNQIRLYSGEKYETTDRAEAGYVCALAGPEGTFPGQGLGTAADGELPFLEALMRYRMILPDGVDGASILPEMTGLSEEHPELHLIWDEHNQEYQVQLMGTVQMEVLERLIQDRFGLTVRFDEGRVIYRETITQAVEGVGHFEPLRHYAEVHVILSPMPAGSGVQVMSRCSEDQLERHWQRLILTHLEEKTYKGVLGDFPITDIKMTLVNGRAHIKHTEGGDFRQATYRAVRQGLMEAKAAGAAVLLEPWYEVRLEVPQQAIGRAMTDLERMAGTIGVPDTLPDGTAVLCGQVPVVSIHGYDKELAMYTKGQGRMTCTFAGYAPCHNAQEILSETAYDPESDTEDPCGSVFCVHGGSDIVPWDKVKERMHLPAALNLSGETNDGGGNDLPDARRTQTADASEEEAWMGTDEVDAIIEKTFFSNRRSDGKRRGKWNYSRSSERTGSSFAGGNRTGSGAVTRSFGTAAAKKPDLPEYLLVDGYNIIYAWETLRDYTRDHLDGARFVLMEILCNYQAIRGMQLIVVFDAYRVKGHVTEVSDYKNIHVVYTKEAETADQYIEKFAHEHAGKARITVATSDGLEQVIIRSKGCLLRSAKDLQEDIADAMDSIRENYMDTVEPEKPTLKDILPEIKD